MDLGMIKCLIVGEKTAARLNIEFFAKLLIVKSNDTGDE